MHRIVQFRVAANTHDSEIKRTESGFTKKKKHFFYCDSMVLMDELLVRLKIANNMDFSGDLANIQSIFNYANEYIRPLNKIQFRGGKSIFVWCNHTSPRKKQLYFALNVR